MCVASGRGWLFLRVGFGLYLGGSASTVTNLSTLTEIERRMISGMRRLLTIQLEEWAITSSLIVDFSITNRLRQPGTLPLALWIDPSRTAKLKLEQLDCACPKPSHPVHQSKRSRPR